MTTIHDVPPPTVGGRYTIGELIGRGGAADVYRARDELLGREVAIKMFVTAGSGSGSGSGPVGPAGGPATAASPAPGPLTAPDADVPSDGPAPADVVGDLEQGRDPRHRREVLTLAGLSHPGLVTVYDVGEERGRAYFVMQLIEGDTLAQRIRGGPLGVVDVVALGAALADALAYVHRRGVVHRDVKPGNVLLDADGRAHLSDFGIAAVRDAAPVTEAGMVIGTASYLSPEQVRGEAVLPAVDVYALGLVLIEALTARREYPGNALEAAVARLHRRPAVPAGLPPGLEALLTAMTEDDPAARPAAEDVVHALRAVSREVGMDAETVLSPVLMASTTRGVAFGPLAVGAAASTGVVGAGAGARVEGTDPGRLTRRARVAALIGAGALAAAAAGSAVAYTLVAQPVAPPPPPPVASAPALPPAPPVTTTSTAEAASEVYTATRVRTRVTTTTPETLDPLPPVASPVAPPPATTPATASTPTAVPTTPPTTTKRSPRP